MAWHIHTCMGISRYFHVVFDVRVFDLNQSNELLRTVDIIKQKIARLNLMRIIQIKIFNIFLRANPDCVANGFVFSLMHEHAI